MDPKTLDDLAKKLADAVPASIKHMQEDVEKNLRAGLESAFERLNLITREEFEVQEAVLLRTREKVEALERRVAELEAQVLPQRPDAPNDTNADGY